MLYKVKRFFKKIQKIFEYLPVLWKDEDWDFDYLLTLIEFKAKRIAKCIREDNIIITEEQVKITAQVNEMCEHLANYRDISRLVKQPFEVINEFVKNDDGTTSFISLRKDTMSWSSDDEREWHAYVKETLKREKEEWHNFCHTLEEYAQGWWD